jgi:lysophospholipase L1-like esterase
MMKKKRLIGLMSVGALVLFACVVIATVRPRAASGTWITAWGTSQQGLGMTAVSNATVRMIARVTIPGEAVRIRLDNTFGTTPLRIGAAYVGHRIQAAALAKGSNRRVTVNGKPDFTLPPGGTVVSDPVTLKVAAWQDLAISLFVPEAGVQPSQHTGAVVTSYLSADGSGDVAAEEAAMPFARTTTSMFWLKSIDVLSASSPGAIIAFGDSITDGTCATLDAHDRWEDWLAVRLQLAAATRAGSGPHKAVVNEGIGGNTLTREGLQPPPDSPPAVERFERDVLAHHGVTDVVEFIGTNDIRRGASAEQVIAAKAEIAKRVKAKGLRIIGVTIIPRHNVAPSGTNTGWNAQKTAFRNQVNQWIRTKGPFDAVLDFDKVVRDPGNADLIDPAFNCGDGIHPSPLGYYRMGLSIPLEVFGHRPNRTN